MEIKPVARIYTEYSEKFGIPRQSGIVNSEISKIVFEPDYKDENFIRGIEDFSHLWLIWQFSENIDKKVSPTVRPPRLGGNRRMGVFATRSPFRPNFLGLSSVKLLEVKKETGSGKVLIVQGADLMNGTPIFDIKPYLSFTDSHPDAICGFTENLSEKLFEVCDEKSLLTNIPTGDKNKIIDVLSHDIRPGYQNDESRIYSVKILQYDIKFSIKENKLNIIFIENE